MNCSTNWSLSLLAFVFFTSPVQAQQKLFDSKSEHPWNRLHRQLYERMQPDGKRYEHDGLEPAFVRNSKFLTEGVSHRRAIDRLDEFLEQDAQTKISDPLQRAILQRDLWAVFVTTADPTILRQPQRRALQKRLAQVMRRVALSADEIERLPENLSAAVKSETYTKNYNPNHPDRPFLPNELVKTIGSTTSPRPGSWVLVRSRLRRDKQAAPNHVRATDGRSAFLIFLRLPAGRSATLDYLNKLKELPPNKMIPQIPRGTQVALLRRMILIDKAGKLRLTPLTESLQIRVYRKLAAPDMYEFKLNRKDLFAGRAGGLRATAKDEINYFSIGFLGSSPHVQPDPFERKFPPANPPITPVVMKSCVKCHAGPGIFGFQSMFVDHFDRPPLGPSELKEQVSLLFEKTQKTYAWGLLQGLWETDTKQ